MTAKEKAKEIYLKYSKLFGYFGMMDVYFGQKEECKKACIFCVDEILKEIESERVFERLEYWEEVKTEIETL